MFERRLTRFAAMVAVALLVAACSSASGAADETADGSGGEIQTTQWVLRSYASEGALVLVPDDQYADADFRAQRVNGFAGCNDYDAVYRNSGRLLLVTMPITTRMSCGEAADGFESAFLGLLQQSRFYNVRADTLTIRGPDLAVLLVFDAAPSNPLLGSWIVDSYSTGPGAQTTPLEGSNLTAVFRLAKVGGSSGCNTYEGPYTTNGTIAAIGPLASTRLACPDDVMAQETSFLAALQGVGRVERRAGTVQLEDLSGGVLVALSKPSEAVPSPGPSAGPTAGSSPSVVPSSSASAKPTAKPSATATVAPTPTATPTAVPSSAPSGSPAPTVAPPASLPPVATCALVTPPDVTLATIVYPADWNTIATPQALACRYFDPDPISVPADPATLTTAVMIKSDVTVSYADALAAATNPTAWNVLTNEPVTISGRPATRLQATSTAGSPGFPVGVTRYGYLIDIGVGSAWFETSGTVGDPSYVEDMSVVDLMASQSTIATSGS
jgi:heat shock protein HslJ